jgi:thioredoxin-related protein
MIARKTYGNNRIMRSMILLVSAASLILTSAGWRTDFDKAKSDAKKEHKLILLTFSGSDWCLPCIRMEEDVFSKETFTHFADANLEMVNADFPRTHKLSNTLTKQNDALAEQYDKEGDFPYTVLLDADGQVLKTWNGYKGEKPETLVQQIKPYVGTN